MAGSSRSLGTLTLDLVLKAQNLTAGMSKAARQVEAETKNIQRALVQNVSGGVNEATAALNNFGKSVIGIAAAWQGLTASITAADAWTNLNNRIRLVTSTQADFVAAQDAILSIAKETRQPLEATAELYQRIATNQDALGLSGQGVADIVQTISKALVVSGTSAQGAQAALVQLGQAFASGTLRGEELNSVLEQAPALANAVAAGLGVPIGKLRELGKEGKLSAEAVIGALENQSSAIDDAFQTMDTTVSQALTNVKTNFTELIGRFSEATGASKGLAAAIGVLGNNIPAVAAAFGAFASIKITQQLASRIAIFKETNAAIIAQTSSELANAQAVELNARKTLLAAEAEVIRARAIGGSVAISAEAAAATLAHRQAILALEQAQLRAAVAANVFGRAVQGTLAFFGGPVGLALLVATTAASWLIFRDNTEKAEQSLIDLNGTLDESIKKFGELNRAQRAGEILQIQDEIAEGNRRIADSLSLMANEADFTDMFDTFGPAIKDLESQWKSGKITADQFSDGISKLGDELLATGQITEEQRRGIIEYAANIATSAREVEKKNEILGIFVGKQNAAATATDGTSAAIRDQASALQAGQKALSDYIGKLDQTINQGVVSLVKKTKGEFAALQVEVGQVINAAGGVDKLDASQRAAINEFLDVRKKQIDAEVRYDKSVKASRASTRAAAKDVNDAQRDAERLEKATRQMRDTQREWQTELDGTGNRVMDDYSKRLDEITEKATKFKDDGIPTEKIKQFREEMTKLAESLKVKELAEFSQEFADQTAQIGLAIEGSASPALLKYTTEVRELDKVLKSGAISQKEYQERLQALSDERNSQSINIIKDLEFETSLLGKTADEQERLTLARQLGADAATVQGEAAIQALKDFQAASELQDFIDDTKEGLGSMFVDFISGAKTAKEAFGDFADDLFKRALQFVADKAIQALFDAFDGDGKIGGKTSTGGGIWDNLLGAFSAAFGGGRAAGGQVNPGMFYRINESGMEMATVDGKDYLMTGSKSGTVTSARSMGGVSVVNNFKFASPTSQRTQEQVAQRMGQKVEEIQRRNG